MNPEGALDYSTEFAAEDEAIERIIHDLSDDRRHIPKEEINDVAEKLHQPGTAVIEGEGYRIHRDPVKVFDIDWKEEQDAA